jgi:hypothetical protein
LDLQNSKTIYDQNVTEYGEAFDTDDFKIMQMVKMLIVVVTVYTLCYFPINALWVSHMEKLKRQKRGKS